MALFIRLVLAVSLLFKDNRRIVPMPGALSDVSVVNVKLSREYPSVIRYVVRKAETLR